MRGSRFRRSVVALVCALAGLLIVDASAIVAATTDPATTTTVAAPAIRPPGNHPRILHWSGLSWLIYPASTQGPDQDPLNDSETAVYLDTHKHLHLKIEKIGKDWHSTQLAALWTPQYGTYRWVTHGRFRNFDKFVVLGLFVFSPSAPRLSKELDIENGKFGGTPSYRGYNAQFAVQPYYSPHHRVHYLTPRGNITMTQTMVWKPGLVKFKTSMGSKPGGRVLKRFSYRGPDVPQPSGERLVMNLWMFHHHKPTRGTRNATLYSFHFTPA